MVNSVESDRFSGIMSLNWFHLNETCLKSIWVYVYIECCESLQPWPLMKVSQSRAQRFCDKQLWMTCILEIYKGCLLLCSIIISAESVMLPRRLRITPHSRSLNTLTLTNTHKLPSFWRRWCWSADQQWTSDLEDALDFLQGNYPGVRKKDRKRTWGQRASCWKHPSTPHITSLSPKQWNWLQNNV